MPHSKSPKDVVLCERIAVNIEKYRKSRGLTQVAFANQIGVSQKVIWQWETCLNTPSACNLVKIADIFCVSLDTLVGRDGENVHPI